MAVEVKYLTSATAVFLNLQSGCARPYWEVNITVSGDASTTSGILGQAYSANNHIVSMGSIDREKPITVSGLSRIIAGDLNISLDNTSGLYSPRHTGSIFCDAAGSAKDYMHSVINVWGGFENISGTAYTLQRGSFLLTKLELDSANRLAYITAEDIAKIPLNRYVGLPDLSGTALSWVPTSGYSTKAIMSELLSGVGLTAGQYSLESGLNFFEYELVSAQIGMEIAKLAQANDGFVYTNGNGQIVFGLNQPAFDVQGVDYALNGNNNTMGLRYSIDVNSLLNKVQINYTSGSNLSRSAEDTSIVKGRAQIITNDVIRLNSVAISLSSRLLEQFKIYKPYIEVNNLWLPSLELGDIIEVTDTGTHQTAISYEIFHIIDDIDNLKTKIQAVDITNNETKGATRQKWGFVSSNELTNPDFETWSDGPASAPDGWAKVGADSTIAREDTIIKLGTYSAKLTRVGTNCYISQSVHANKGIAYWQGKTVTFSVWVNTDTALTAVATIGDGVAQSNSSYHTGGSTWELLTVTRTIDASATYVTVYLQVVTNDKIAYIDGAICIEGSDTTERGYYFTEGWHSGFAFTSMDSATGSSTDYLENANFETVSGNSPANWFSNGSGTATIDGVTFYEGAGAAKVVHSGAGIGWMRIYNSGRDSANITGDMLTASYPLQFSAWVKCAVSNCAFIQIDLSSTAQRSIHHPGDNQWHQLAVVVNPEITDTSAVMCSMYVTGTASEAWFDQARLRFDVGFDSLGNLNGIITTGYAASGAGTTGIELPFLTY